MLTIDFGENLPQRVKWSIIHSRSVPVNTGSNTLQYHSCHCCRPVHHTARSKRSFSNNRTHLASICSLNLLTDSLNYTLNAYYIHGVDVYLRNNLKQLLHVRQWKSYTNSLLFLFFLTTPSCAHEKLQSIWWMLVITLHTSTLQFVLSEAPFFNHWWLTSVKNIWNG